MGTYADARTFVVAWMHLSEMDLQTEVITALNNFHAIELSSQDLVTLQDMHENPTLDQVKSLAFSRNGLITVKEIERGNV